MDIKEGCASAVTIFKTSAFGAADIQYIGEADSGFLTIWVHFSSQSVRY